MFIFDIGEVRYYVTRSGLRINNGLIIGSHDGFH